jgi:acyl-CoA thioester hydrolase
VARDEFRFSFPFRVRYSEVDKQGVVFNAHYLTYFDTAITEYLRDLGFDYLDAVEKSDTDFHTVKSLVEYKEPIAFDQKIDVCVRADRVGRSSLTFRLEIHPHEEDRVLAAGEIVWVHTNRLTRKSTPVPSSFVTLLESREGRALVAAEKGGRTTSLPDGGSCVRVQPARAAGHRGGRE